MPFGEYIPFRQQLGWLTKVSNAAASNMIPGTGAHLLQATDRAGRPLPIGVLVCFESAFPDMSRVDTEQGAQLIVYQSATPTFQGTWGPDQHASLGAVRAAETGRPVVQAALTGVTVAFDARGRLLAWMGQSSHGVVSVRLGLPAASATVYDRFGDYVPWSAAAVVILAVLVMFANSRGFPGRSAGSRAGHEAQYVAGQSVRDTLARPQGKANLVYKEARCPRMVFCTFIPCPRRCARTSSGLWPESWGRPLACHGCAVGRSGRAAGRTHLACPPGHGGGDRVRAGRLQPTQVRGDRGQLAGL